MLMRLVFLGCLMWLTGCSGFGVGVPATPGAFLVAPQGDQFKEMDTLDPRNAMVYIYRPATQWGYEEVQAPIVFIDDEQLFGLKAGAYEWLELHAGTYDFHARRPLSVLYLKTIFDLPLEVEGGQTYYFRYSETNSLDLAELVPNPEDYHQDGPLQQVPSAIGKREIAYLRLDEPGVFYGAQEKKPRWAPFYTYPGEDGSEGQENPGSERSIGRVWDWMGFLF